MVNGDVVTDGYTIDYENGMVMFDTPLTSSDKGFLPPSSHVVEEHHSGYVAGLTAAGAPPHFFLNNEPIPGTVHLFANGYEVDPQYYMVNPLEKKITVLPGGLQTVQLSLPTTPTTRLLRPCLVL